MPRPLSYTPDSGPVLTLADLREFLAEAESKGYPDNATPRVMGGLGAMSMTHGPLATRITLVPGEVSE